MDKESGMINVYNQSENDCCMCCTCVPIAKVGQLHLERRFSPAATLARQILANQHLLKARRKSHLLRVRKTQQKTRREGDAKQRLTFSARMSAWIMPCDERKDSETSSCIASLRMLVIDREKGRICRTRSGSDPGSSSITMHLRGHEKIA